MSINLRKLLLDKIERDGGAKITAEDLGVAYTTVFRWKEGVKNPSLPIIQRLLDDHLAVHPAEDLGVGAGKVLILMPIRRTVEGRTFATLTRALAHYGRDQVEVLTQFNTDVDRARCILADRALAVEGATDFIFCDEDAVLPCGYGPYLRGMGYDLPDPNAGLNAIARLLTAPQDHGIVSALCFARRTPLVAACSSGVRGGASAAELVARKAQPGETGMEPQDWVGMHFCLVRRRVLEDMRAKLPEIAPRVPNDPYGYFLKEHAGQSEDGSFCAKAKRAGHGCFLDTTLRVGHIMQGVV